MAARRAVIAVMAVVRIAMEEDKTCGLRGLNAGAVLTATTSGVRRAQCVQLMRGQCGADLALQHKMHPVADPTVNLEAFPVGLGMPVRLDRARIQSPVPRGDMAGPMGDMERLIEMRW